VRRCLERARTDLAWERRRAELPDGRGLGVGVGLATPSAAGFGTASDTLPWALVSVVEVELRSDGLVHVRLGPHDDPGIARALERCVAATLGVRAQDVVIDLGDTDACPPASASERADVDAVLACVEASASIATRVRDAAAQRWACSPSVVRIEHGEVLMAGADAPRVALATAATWAIAAGVPLLARAPALGATDEPTAVGGCAVVADVEVDIELGQVLVRALRVWQAGGLARAGEGVREEVARAVRRGIEAAMIAGPQASAAAGWAPGVPASPVGDAAVPEVPITVELLCGADDEPLGPPVAVVGDAPMHATVAAILNAVHDAIGLHLDELPLHPARVWRALAGRVAAEASGERLPHKAWRGLAAATTSVEVEPLEAA
jgi:CO/xanthine dehydrogenase Mo-binding subunit